MMARLFLEASAGDISTPSRRSLRCGQSCEASEQTDAADEARLDWSLAADLCVRHATRTRFRGSSVRLRRLGAALLVGGVAACTQEISLPTPYMRGSAVSRVVLSHDLQEQLRASE